MVSSKVDIVQTESIEPLAEYPGFVKVFTGNITSSNIKEYLKTKSLNENIPQKIIGFIKRFTKLFPTEGKESIEVSLDCKPLGVAHKIEVSHNHQPIPLQQSSLNEMQKVFLENFYRSSLQHENNTVTKDVLAKFSSWLDETSESFKKSEIDISDFMGNLLKLLQEEITNPADKFNENNSSKGSSYLCMAGYESPQGRIGDTENSEEEGKPAQRRAKESRKEAVSGNDTQQKSIETIDVANISNCRLAVDENGRVFDALNFRCNIIKVIFI